MADPVIDWPAIARLLGDARVTVWDRVPPTYVWLGQDRAIVLCAPLERLHEEVARYPDATAVLHPDDAKRLAAARDALARAAGPTDAAAAAARAAA